MGKGKMFTISFSTSPLENKYIRTSLVLGYYTYHVTCVITESNFEVMKPISPLDRAGEQTVLV